MQKQSLDLRNLMIGDSRLLTGAIELVETQMGPTLNAVLCIPLPNSIRDTVVQAITHGAKSQVNTLSCVIFLFNILYLGSLDVFFHYSCWLTMK